MELGRARLRVPYDNWRWTLSVLRKQQSRVSRAQTRLDSSRHSTYCTMYRPVCSAVRSGIPIRARSDAPQSTQLVPGISLPTLLCPESVHASIWSPSHSHTTYGAQRASRLDTRHHGHPHRPTSRLNKTQPALAHTHTSVGLAFLGNDLNQQTCLMSTRKESSSSWMRVGTSLVLFLHERWLLDDRLHARRAKPTRGALSIIKLINLDYLLVAG
jgi:hypothetical protein